MLLLLGVDAAHLGNNISCLPKRCYGFDYLHSSPFIGKVSETSVSACATLDDTVKTKFLQLQGAVGRHRHALFTLGNFFW